MNRIQKISLTISLLLCFISTLFSQENKMTATFDYLGETPPDTIAKVFNPMYFNPEGWHEHSSPVFSPDGNEVYFSVYNEAENNFHVIMCIKKQDNDSWAAPEIVPFSGLRVGNLPVIDDYPFITPDGQQLFFCSDRSMPEKLGWQNADIWFVNKTDTGWSEPVKAGLPIPAGQMDIYPTVAANGNLYFTGGTTKYGLYLAEKTGENEYARPGMLRNGINSTTSDWNSYIAPDEDYYIFSSMRIQNDYGELFITYKQSNGAWSTPANMGNKINTSEQEKYPVVTPDGKYLFFMRSWADKDSLYWISSKIIEDLRNYDPYINIRIPDATAYVDSSFSFTIPESTFIDDDGQETLNLSAALSTNQALPDWLTFAPKTQTFSGRPEREDRISIRVTATDETGKIVSDIFTITVIQAIPTGVSEKSPQSTGFRLEQNYPNPFNPKTTINYSLEKPSEVKLKIYNLNGQCISTLVEGLQSTGNHSIIWNTKNENVLPVSSGIYIYCLETEMLKLQRKMLLVR